MILNSSPKGNSLNLLHRKVKSWGQLQKLRGKSVHSQTSFSEVYDHRNDTVNASHYIILNSSSVGDHMFLKL